MADAVADEIDELKRDMSADFESKIGLMGTRVQNAQLSADRAENEQAKFKFQIDRIADEMQRKMAESGDKEQFIIVPSQLAETEQKVTLMKSETKKLFDQMRHIMQAQSLQIQTCMRDVERIES